MSFGEGNLHERVSELETLVRDMHGLLDSACDASSCDSCPILGEGCLGEVNGRMAALGLLEGDAE